MKPAHTYTYTTLRYVHDVGTGEFINVGVAIYSKEARYSGALCRTTYGRLSKMFPGIDGDSFKNMMRFVQARFETIGARITEELPFEELPSSVLELAHAVLPSDDSSLQWSPIGSGLTENSSVTLEKLYERLVTQNDEKHIYESRSDEDVWRKYKRSLESRHVLKYLTPKKITVQDDEVEFNHAWKNGVWHCLEPISFDLSSADTIREKAHKWLGQITSLKSADEPFKVYALLGEPQSADLRGDFEKALSILRKAPIETELIRESDAVKFSMSFAEEIAAHEKSRDGASSF
ncbi:MAG: DUF3037 domain-containing protein [Verrucomicrobia bacterium]|nr:DUF3037 domain-containing protein [Verrucomicrobiota bacterium]